MNRYLDLSPEIASALTQGRPVVALESTIISQWELGLDGGAVIANPVPAEHSMEPAVIDKAIERALAVNPTFLVFGKKANLQAVLSQFDATVKAMKQDGSYQAVVKEAFK
jgi:pseudouridine-5'-phosphate glycosidase